METSAFAAQLVAALVSIGLCIAYLRRRARAYVAFRELLSLPAEVIMRQRSRYDHACDAAVTALRGALACFVASSGCAYLTPHQQLPAQLAMLLLLVTFVAAFEFQSSEDRLLDEAIS